MQSKRPRRAVGITQPPNQWAQECLLLEVTLLIEMCVSLCGAIPSLPYVELYLHSLIRLHALIFNWIQRQTCLYLYFPSSYKYISKITTWNFFFLLGATTLVLSWPSQQFLSISGDLGLRGELSYLAPLGSENFSAPYFKHCFFRGGVLPPSDWVKHHASQSQDRNNKYFILYIEFCINNKI